jgi:hypothetical protein
VEHAVARLKNWRILRDHRRRGCHVADTLQAVAVLHNLHLDELRDNFSGPALPQRITPRCTDVPGAS